MILIIMICFVACGRKIAGVYNVFIVSGCGLKSEPSESWNGFTERRRRKQQKRKSLEQKKS